MDVYYSPAPIIVARRVLDYETKWSVEDGANVVSDIIWTPQMNAFHDNVLTYFQTHYIDDD